MNVVFSWVLILCFTLCPGRLFASSIDVNQEARYFIDGQGLPVEEVLQKPERYFDRAPPAPYSLLQAGATLWLKWEHVASAPGLLYLENSFTTTDEMDVFHILPDGQAMEIQRTGDYRSFLERQIRYRFPLVSLQVRPGKNLVLIRLKAEEPLVSQIRAYIFCIAWAVLILASINLTFAYLGLIDFEASDLLFVVGGALLEAILLSLALGYKIDFVEREKRDHQLAL